MAASARNPFSHDRHQRRPFHRLGAHLRREPARSDCRSRSNPACSSRPFSRTSCSGIRPPRRRRLRVAVYFLKESSRESSGSEHYPRRPDHRKTLDDTFGVWSSQKADRARLATLPQVISPRITETEKTVKADQQPFASARYPAKNAHFDRHFCKLIFAFALFSSVSL